MTIDMYANLGQGQGSRLQNSLFIHCVSSNVCSAMSNVVAKHICLYTLAFQQRNNQLLLKALGY